MPDDHDSRYKLLFSHPTILKQLLENFVHEPFVKELDFSTSERVDKSFVTKHFQKKESDLIYKIKFRGKYVYIYILIEFQSTVDAFMALRMLRYICEFYEHLTSTEIKRLPGVFPILLYNGSAKWTAKLNIQELIHKDIPEKFVPNFSYYPIIENEISKETLLEIKNALSAIFYIETSDAEEISNNLQKILDLMMKEKPDIIILFRNWFLNIFKNENDEFYKPIYNLEELKTMLRDSLKKYKKKLFEEGRLEGKLEGKLEGEKKGIRVNQVETVKKMFRLKFSINDISAVTGLSVEEIEKIRDEE